MKYIHSLISEFLEAGKIMIYLDMYGQMIEDKPSLQLATSNVNCSELIPGYLFMPEAMKYVIVALTHWTDIPDNNVDRFEESSSSKFDGIILLS